MASKDQFEYQNEQRRLIRDRILEMLDGAPKDVWPTSMIAAVGNAFTDACTTVFLEVARKGSKEMAIEALDRYRSTLNECLDELEREIRDGEPQPKDWSGGGGEPKDDTAQ